MLGDRVYAEFVRSLVDRQDERKSSIEARGITVITTSGALATLLFGLLTVGGSATSFASHGISLQLLRCALIAFVVAAIFGLAANFPRNYGEPAADTPRSLLDGPWAKHDESRARREVTKAWGKVFAAAKPINAWKAWLLTIAIAAEVAAVGCVAALVWLSL